MQSRHNLCRCGCKCTIFGVNKASLLTVSPVLERALLSPNARLGQGTRRSNSLCRHHFCGHYEFRPTNVRSSEDASRTKRNKLYLLCFLLLMAVITLNCDICGMSTVSCSANVDIMIAHFNCRGHTYVHQRHIEFIEWVLPIAIR